MTAVSPEGFSLTSVSTGRPFFFCHCKKRNSRFGSSILETRRWPAAVLRIRTSHSSWLALRVVLRGLRLRWGR